MEPNFDIAMVLAAIPVLIGLAIVGLVIALLISGIRYFRAKTKHLEEAEKINRMNISDL